MKVKPFNAILTTSMKKFLSALLAAVLLLSATACAAHEPVLPPSRWGEMQIRSMFERYYSISDAFQAADAVARVTVGDWQGEDLHNWVTFFDADVQESYKGDLPRHFTLVQGGCSEATSPDYPLFTSGTELLVFLRDYDGSGEKYHPITDYNTVLYVVYDEAGDRYFLDSFGTMSAQDTCVPGSPTWRSFSKACPDIAAARPPGFRQAVFYRLKEPGTRRTPLVY